MAGDFAVLHAEDFRREFADEMHVVRDEDERAGVVLQRARSRLLTHLGWNVPGVARAFGAG